MSIPQSDLAGLRGAHRRLLRDLTDLGDTDLSTPSRLSGWSMGHVITHLARNADGFTRMVMAAARGGRGRQYEGGAEQRASDIEFGANRTARDQIDDLRRSIDDLDAAWGRLGPRAWATGMGFVVSGERRVMDMPFRRWREVEMHHVDLGRPTFTYEDWSEAYVQRELDQMVKERTSRLVSGNALLVQFEDSEGIVSGQHIEIAGGDPAVAVSGTRRWVLAWLTGRLHAPGLPPLEPWP